MAKPKREIEGKEYFKEIHFLYEIFNSLKNVEEIKLFIKDILTKSELRMLKRRWHVATLLMSGLDIRKVAARSRTSTQTVAKIKRVLEDGTGGLLLALKKAKVKEEEDRRKYLKSKIKPQGSKYVKNWFR